jgi:serine phosphatase RsbU (regulator of sigma subunit)
MDESTETSENLRLIDSLRYRRAGLRIRMGSLWPAIKRFGTWMEHQALPAARQAELMTARIRINPNGEVQTIGFTLTDSADDLQKHRKVWQFLCSLNIRQLELDTRLESNQIEDVLAMLFIADRTPSQEIQPSNRPVLPAKLLSTTGAHAACSSIRLRNETLTVTHSYCVTRFSQTVRWFERRYRPFSDHRALFHAAPRYAAVVGLVAVVPFLVYTFFNSWWLLLAVTAGGAMALYAMTCLFFMIVGSVEYDNEEKAFRLNHAYDRLKTYTERIQADIQRARTVQERILPDISSMPLADQVEWASSYVPETEVGGDYFDAHALDNHRVAVLFADVSGHGMAAAFITAILKTAFQAWIDEGGTLVDLVRRMNHALCEFTPDDSFAAVFVAIYDAATSTVNYINAGHQPEPWLIPARNDEPIRQLSDARALLLGVIEDFEISESSKPLRSGDMILFVSDGLIEAINVDGERYGMKRFETLLQSHRSSTANQLVDIVIREVSDFANEAEQTDDRTVLAFRIK